MKPITGPRTRGPRLDLLLFKHGRRIGVECKRMDAPTLTPSMRIALEDLKLDRLIVVYPGERRYPLAERVEVVPLADLVAGESSPDSVFKRRRSVDCGGVSGGLDISRLGLRITHPQF